MSSVDSMASYGLSSEQLGAVAACSTFMLIASVAASYTNGLKREAQEADLDYVGVDKRGGSKKGRKKKARFAPINRADNFYYKYYPGNGQAPYPVVQNPADDTQIDEATLKSSRKLFRDTYGVPNEIYEELLGYCKGALTPGKDATGMGGMMPELALLIALKKLRTGNASVQFKESTGYGTSTIDAKFKVVVETLVEKLRPICLPGYFHESMKGARDQEFAYNASMGFPGCGGSVDGSLVEWGKCPKEEQGQHKGHKGCGIVVHAVAFHTLFCAHLFVGVPGAANDVQVLYRDPIFHALVSGAGNIAALMLFVLTYPLNIMYFLADVRIFPTAMSFVWADTHFELHVHLPQPDLEYPGLA